MDIEKARKITRKGEKEHEREIIRRIKGEGKKGRSKFHYPYSITPRILEKLRNRGFQITRLSEYVEDWWKISWI